MIKILFYGNCQLGAIARYVRTKMKNFDIQLCTDVGTQFFWDPGLIAAWKNEKDVQSKLKLQIHKKIQECDIFVFQDHSGLSMIPELQTKFLHDNIVGKNTKAICMPDVRLFIHPLDWKCIGPYVGYIHDTLYITNSQHIINVLKESEDPKLTELLMNNFPVNKTFSPWFNENIRRYENNLKDYETVISMNDFMEDRYTKEILFESFSHPGISYFEELLKRFFTVIGVTDHQIIPLNPWKDIAGFASLDPRQFNFFTKNYPDIDYTGFNGVPITTAHIDRCLGR